MPKFESIPDLIASYESRFIPEKAEGVDAIVQFNFTGDQASTFFVTIKDQTLTTKEGTHDNPLLTVTSSVKDWLKINNGESNPMTMMMTGKLKVEGPIQMAARFQSMFE